MSGIYACPVHVDRQSTDGNHRCPLCGQRPILLRGAATAGQAVAPSAGQAQPPEGEAVQGAPKAPLREGGTERVDGTPAIGTVLDQVIRMLTELRDRVPDLKA